MYLRGESDACAKGGERGGKEKRLALALESPYLLLLVLVPRRLLLYETVEIYNPETQGKIDCEDENILHEKNVYCTIIENGHRLFLL